MVSSSVVMRAKLLVPLLAIADSPRALDMVAAKGLQLPRRLEARVTALNHVAGLTRWARAISLDRAHTVARGWDRNRAARHIRPPSFFAPVHATGDGGGPAPDRGIRARAL